MAEFLFYGLDEAGEPAFSEVLTGDRREPLRALAEQRLEDWPAVEIWEGPLCLVRLRRTREPQA